MEHGGIELVRRSPPFPVETRRAGQAVQRCCEEPSKRGQAGRQSEASWKQTMNGRLDEICVSLGLALRSDPGRRKTGKRLGLGYLTTD